jgi:hypothetical protein
VCEVASKNRLPQNERAEDTLMVQEDHNAVLSRTVREHREAKEREARLDGTQRTEPIEARGGSVQDSPKQNRLGRSRWRPVGALMPN